MIVARRLINKWWLDVGGNHIHKTDYKHSFIHDIREALTRRFMKSAATEQKDAWKCKRLIIRTHTLLLWYDIVPFCYIIFAYILYNINNEYVRGVWQTTNTNTLHILYHIIFVYIVYYYIERSYLLYTL